MQQNSASVPFTAAYPASTQAPMMYSQVHSPQTVQVHYQKKCVRGLAVTVIVLGAFCFIFQVADIAIGNPVSVVGTGIWCGALFIAVGVVGLASSAKPTMCMIAACLIMSTIGAIFAIGPLTAGSIGIGEAHFIYWCGNYWCYVDHEGSIAVNALLICTSVSSGILLIIMSVLACHGACCGPPQPHAVTPGQVHYVSAQQGQQQLILVPMTQPMATTSNMPFPAVQVMAPGMPQQQQQQIAPIMVANAQLNTGTASQEDNYELPPGYDGADSRRQKYC